jgi:hypothetical protein
MKLSHRIRAHLLKRKRDRRLHKQSAHMIGRSSWSINPETIVLAAIAFAAVVLIKFVPL